MSEEFIFSENLRKIREYKGLTQQQLANMAGMSKTAVSNYEINYSMPQARYLKRLTAALGVTAADLFSEDFDPAVHEALWQSNNQEKMYLFPTQHPTDVIGDVPQTITSYIDMPKTPAMRGNKNIVVVCPDNAMDNAGFSQDDYIIVSRCMSLKDDGIYALFADDTFYIRRVNISNDIITLIPDSNYKDYTPVQINAKTANILVVGRVIHSIKNY